MLLIGTNNAYLIYRSTESLDSKKVETDHHAFSVGKEKILQSLWCTFSHSTISWGNGDMAPLSPSWKYFANAPQS